MLVSPFLVMFQTYFNRKNSKRNCEFKEHSKGTWTLGHSKGIPSLEHSRSTRAFGQSRHFGTWTFEPLEVLGHSRNMDTRITRALIAYLGYRKPKPYRYSETQRKFGHSGTQALGHSSHLRHFI